MEIGPTEAQATRPGAWMPRPVSGVPSGVILFDGVCVFCSRWVTFVIARDRAKTFRFLPIQNEDGRRLAERIGITPDDPETNAVVLDGVAYLKSDAALMVLARLPDWSWTRLGWAFPKGLRDWTYDRIANNRYRIFGRLDACMVPSPEVRGRFLDRLPSPS
jgi:predicted DCC family thiol-disulfide oxidoreductase YuxK